MDVGSMKPEWTTLVHVDENGLLREERVLHIPLRDEWAADDPDAPSDLK